VSGVILPVLRRRLGLERGVAALAAGLFVFGFGQELWARYLPEYLRWLGASALLVGAFGSLQDLLDAAYAYPGGILSDRLGSRMALLLSGGLTATGLALYLFWNRVAGIFAGLLLVTAWRSLGLPATFAIVAEELSEGKRIAGFTAQAVIKRLPIVLAPPIGGLLLERLGMAGGMRLGFAISLALSIAMLIGMGIAFRSRRDALSHALTPAPSRAEREKTVAKSPALNPALSRREREKTRLHPTLRRLLVADCLIRLCEGLPGVFLVLWALEVVRISPARFGLLQSVLMTTAILSYFPAVALAGRAEKKPFVVLTFLFFTLFPVAVVLSHSFGSLAAAYVVGGLREIGEPARKSLIVDLADAGTRGRSVGLYYSIRGFAVAGAAAAGGALWTIRPALTFFAAAALGAAGTIWFWVALPGRAGSAEAAA
jgi:MFS family permease